MGYAKIKAQVAIELTLSLILLLVFLVATAKIFVWLGNGIVKRHEAYESTRTAAGDGEQVASKIKFYTPERLDIFSNW